MHRYPTIIALTGFAGAGKTTVAREILCAEHGFKRMSFAARLKEMAVDGYVIKGERWFWDGISKGPLERANLQYIGDVERAKDPLVFVRPIIHALAKSTTPIVLDDCRYFNEWINLELRGAKLWRITSHNVGAANDHRSETEHLRFDPDAIIRNDIPMMDVLRRAVAEALRKTTQCVE